MTKAFQEPPSASAEGSLDLREFLQKVTRRKWLILGVVVLVAVRSLESRSDRYDSAPAANNINKATIHAGEMRRRRF